MIRIPQYLQGDSIGLTIRVRNADPADYDADVFLYASSTGHKVRASTTPCGVCLPLHRQDNGTLVLNIPADVTRRMDAGMYVMETIYTHRSTGATVTLTDKVFYLQCAKNIQYEHTHR